MSKNQFALNKKRARNNFKLHAMDRLRERYGIDLDEEGWIDFKNKMYKAKFLKKQYNSRTVRELEYQGKRVILVWDSAYGEIVTVIPPNGTY